MLSRTHPRQPGLLRRAARARDGLAAIEFALIAPLMILLYFGLAELSSAIIASRHTNHANSALGDLVSQCANVSDSDLTNMFSAAADIMAPLPLTSLTHTVTSVVDTNGAFQVQWSRRYSGASGGAGAGLAPNSTYSFPSNASSVLSANGDTVVVSEATYTFAFPFAPAGTTLPLGGQAISFDFARGLSFDMLSYFKPRRSSQVTYTGLTDSGGTNSQTSCYAS